MESIIEWIAWHGVRNRRLTDNISSAGRNQRERPRRRKGGRKGKRKEKRERGVEGGRAGRRKGRREGEGGREKESLLQGSTSLMFQNLPQTLPPVKDQILRYMRSWGTFLIQATTMSYLALLVNLTLPSYIGKESLLQGGTYMRLDCWDVWGPLSF